MFTVAAESYDRFMGRYSSQLSAPFCDVAGVAAGQRAIDVGCGPGVLTAELVTRLGPDSVAAVDPSAPFVEAARERNPGVDVRLAPAEELPFPDASFDAALAQLVVQFMTDPAAGVAEMRRVTRPGGVVAACVWDHGTERGPLTPLWQAARDLEPDVRGEARLVGTKQGDLESLFGASGLRDVEETTIPARIEYASFEDWWEPFLLGVGPAGQYVAGLDEERRIALRERCRERLGPPPFAVEALAWTARGVV